MMRTVSLVCCVLAQIPVAATAAACNGANPTITSVWLHGVTRTPYLDRYHLKATVTNLGNQAQAGNVLQFVDVIQYGGRLDDRGVPPLAPGQSYTISYTWPRSAEAGKLTSPLDFRMRFVAPLPAANCNPSNGSAAITV
jgi:hypothetical protein